ncbi:hypothetical protein [Paenibacillus sp. UNC451MF]|uniref:hypothetical protein n=1 Tax=Paenibacillus sp. UNC451MF TaxID=1449063 RepID=UPI000491188A|nr:hypothetical protein [Paenibacillus sp. UNC451MF]
MHSAQNERINQLTSSIYRCSHSKIQTWLEQHPGRIREWFQNKLEELGAKLDELLMQIPHVQQLLAMKGIGRDTIPGFLTEVGDLKTNSSGIHNGQTKITKRGCGRVNRHEFLWRSMGATIVYLSIHFLK